MILYRFTIDWTIPGLVVAFGFAIFLGWRLGRVGPRTAVVVGIVALGGGLVLAGEQVTTWLARNSAREVSGRVEGFRPAPFKGREAFTLGGVPFAYTPELTRTGYHQAARDGGVIRPNAALRIRYLSRTPSVADSFGNVIVEIRTLP